jgi:hypothetical protein
MRTASRRIEAAIQSRGASSGRRHVSEAGGSPFRGATFFTLATANTAGLFGRSGAAAHLAGKHLDAS